jgi:hypothetical protein
VKRIVGESTGATNIPRARRGRSRTLGCIFQSTGRALVVRSERARVAQAWRAQPVRRGVWRVAPQGLPPVKVDVEFVEIIPEDISDEPAWGQVKEFKEAECREQRKGKDGSKCEAMPDGIFRMREEYVGYSSCVVTGKKGATCTAVLVKIGERRIYSDSTCTKLLNRVTLFEWVCLP